MIEIPKCPDCSRMAASSGLQPRGGFWELGWLCTNKNCKSGDKQVEPVWVKVQES